MQNETLIREVDRRIRRQARQKRRDERAVARNPDRSWLAVSLAYTQGQLDALSEIRPYLPARTEMAYRRRPR